MSNIYVIADGAERVWTGTGWSLDYSAARIFHSRETANNALLGHVVNQVGTHSSVFIDEIDEDD